MKTIICPTSDQHIDENVARLTGFQVALWLGVYLITDFYPIILFITIDYCVRMEPSRRHSPLSWISTRFLRWRKTPAQNIDKAPKLFAARVGFLYAAFICILYFFSSWLNVFVTAQLIGFALLESVLNVCVGCLVYTYWVLPFFEKEKS